MKKNTTLFLTSSLAIMLLFCTAGYTENKNLIKLPEPKTTGGKPLMDVLKTRRTSREFSETKLPAQTLSNLLWAAFGINSTDGKRTAPTAVNMQEIDIYVSMSDGLYLYDASGNALNLILAQDIRKDTGNQPFVASAPVNLIFVADYAKMERMKSDEMKDFYSAVDTGYISQNVYLFCTSENLATVVRGSVKKPELAKIMKLRSNQKIILCQTVGYPKK